MSASFEPMQLGDRVKDPITKLTGIVVCITTWLHGCIRIGVQPEKVSDGKPAEAVYFDQSQLTIEKRAVHAAMTLGVVPTPRAETRRSAGGPGRESAGFQR